MTADNDAFYHSIESQTRNTGNQANGSNKYCTARKVKNANATPDNKVLLPEYSLILLRARPPYTGNPGINASLVNPGRKSTNNGINGP